MTQDGLGCSICASVSQTDGRGIFERIAVIVQEPDIAQNGPHSTGCLDRSFNHLLQIAIFFGILRSASHRNGVIRQPCGISGRKADDSARIFLGHWVMRDLEKLTGFRSGERTDCIVHHSEPCRSTRQKIWVMIRTGSGDRSLSAPPSLAWRRREPQPDPSRGRVAGQGGDGRNGHIRREERSGSARQDAFSNFPLYCQLNGFAKDWL